MEITFKEFLKENSISVSKLPAGLQAKIKKFDETLEKFNAAPEAEQKKQQARIKEMDETIFKAIEKEATIETEDDDTTATATAGKTQPTAKKTDKGKTEAKEESGGNGFLWFLGIVATAVGLGVLAKKLNEK